MNLTTADVIAGLALLLSVAIALTGMVRRLAKGSFATHADIRALETTMTTTQISHASRIKDVEHGNKLLEERMSHFPDREQFDELKGSIAVLREQHAVVMTKLEEMPRIREAVEELSKEIRESRR